MSKVMPIVAMYPALAISLQISQELTFCPVHVFPNVIHIAIHTQLSVITADHSTSPILSFQQKFSACAWFLPLAHKYCHIQLVGMT